MHSSYFATVLNVASFVVAIGIVVAVCRVQKLPLRETLALRLPTFRGAALWAGLFAVAVVAEEFVAGRLGLSGGAKWSGPLPFLGIKAVGIIVFAPLAEEILFRGLMFGRVAVRLGIPLAIVLTALVFAAVHFQYSAPKRAFVFVDGLIFASARAHSKSLPLAMLLHCAGNTFAVLQRIL